MEVLTTVDDGSERMLSSPANRSRSSRVLQLVSCCGFLAVYALSQQKANNFVVMLNKQQKQSVPA
jgi:hypothetical protein